VTHNSSRKQFFAKLLGVVAASSVTTKLTAKSASPLSPAQIPAASSGVSGRFEIRHDGRAVARADQA
jgi:hypothetical protein